MTLFKNRFFSKLLPVIFGILLTGLLVNKAKAQKTSPVQLSLFNPIQLVSEDTAIEGIRFNLIYGKNVSLTGLDIGLVNHTGSGGFKGLQYGLVNISDASAKGLQLSAVNFGKGEVVGLQWGGVNTSPDMTGFQYGFVNHAGNMRGFQLGLVNYAESMSKGLQIGFVNIIREGGAFPVFPVVNWSF